MTFEELLAELAKDPAKLAKLLEDAGVARAAIPERALVLRNSSGTALGPEKRNELLAKLAAGEHVEIEIDVYAYEQRTGERNRNSVRFRDGAMSELGRSGKGTPFLRDHAQYDSLAKGGVVLASSTEKRGDGDYAVHQTVRLSAPWAVEMALRGLMDSVSIGWRPTGPVMCSLCDEPVFQQCWHFPGERYREELANKTKRYVYDATGDIVVEWIYTKAELVETSVVNVPGVPNARIDDVRASMFASLAAHNPGLRAGEQPTKETGMKFPPELLKLLGLADTASADEVLAAVTHKLSAAAADKSELAIVQKELSVYKTEIDKLNADKRKAAEDKFIDEALKSGRIGKGDENAWRELFALSAERAEKLMGERQPGLSTPVGQPRQAAPVPEASNRIPVITGGESKGMARAREALASNPRAAAFAEAVFGYNPPGGVSTTLGQHGTTIANNADLDAARVGFHAAFLQQLEQNTDDPVQLLYTQVPSSKSVEEWNWLGDLPNFEEWKTDRKLSGLDAFKLRIINRKWSNGLRVKNDDFKDDALGLLPPQVAGLASKARRHRWDMIVQQMLNGFDGAAFPDVGNGLAYDGAFFFSAAHSSAGGPAYSNKLTQALDAAGLTAAELLLESMMTYDGKDPLDIHGSHLIVGPKLRATAEKLLQQERLANGEDNYHRGKYKLIVSNRIRGTQDDYWFLADLSQPIKPMLFQMREEITTSAVIGGQGSQQDSLPRFMNDELWFGAEARYNVGYFEHRLIVGSQVA